MKRKVLLTIALAIAFLAIGSLTFAQTPSVPNLINFQGRLTDNAGNPVANGPHTVNFYIYLFRVGGGAIWSESQSPTTAGGLFTTQLGLVNPLPATLFEDYDSLFLEIEADAQLISPRTLLTSTPSARIANALEVRSNINPAFVGIKASNYGTGHHLEIESATDGFFNQQHGGWGFGESWWSNGAPSHIVSARIGAYPGFGGELGLTDDLGTPRITLSAGNFGDASAILPTDAVNSGEILDEPGVSNSDEVGFLTLGTGAGTTYVIDSVDISIPAAGYVEVSCDGYMNLAHTTGAASSFYTTLSKTQGDAGLYPGSAVARVPAAIATSSWWAFPMSSSRLFVEAVPATYRYYVMITHESGTNLSSDGLNFTSLRAKYFPSLYGTTTLANTPSGVNRPMTTTASGTSAPVSNVEVTTITAADHNARLEAERAKQIADLEARIKQLEGRMAGQLPGQGVEAPRKER